MLNKFTIIAITGVLSLGAVGAQAGEKPERPYTVQDEATRAACGECHMVFPPSKLTGGGWKKIMAGLKDHFGDNAELPDAQNAAHIEAYLVANALDANKGIRTKMRLEQWAKRGLVDPIRITETPEWTRHHTQKQTYRDMGEKVGYTRGANCVKCHTRAERGFYEEFNK